MASLKITQFGNNQLRQVARKLTKEEINSSEVKELIKNMRALLIGKRLGVGLAAPQVGKSVELAIIEIQKTALRENIEKSSLVIINPKITKFIGRKTQMWEGCISSGVGKAGLFAKVPRYKKIELEYLGEDAQKHTETFSDLVAHVVQHEVDHLKGVLFVDKVKDTSTYMTYNEYKKMKLRSKD